MLNTRELEIFKKELEEMKFKIEKILNSHSSTTNTIKTNQAKDEADYASVEKGQSIANTLMTKQSEKLQAIERSFKRMENGTYGICDSCGEAINIERLKVKIFADYCIGCREIVEMKTK